MVTPSTISTGWHPLARGIPPDWASAWGQDQYGVFVEFTIEDVTQRLRWIPPGRFLMGSADGEKGRWDDEGPQHPVTLSEGFWLFATPCTQALWQAVMEDNPSCFEGQSNPVEWVSWNEVQTFLEAINERVPDLALCLPSEAQWEHACRAGTTTAYSYGDKADHEQMNIAASEIKQTTSVDRYPPKPWGLHDMHGNVWEWCRDGFRKFKSQTEVDPEGPETGHRVLRGGSWANDARRARSACRNHNGPVVRYDVIGFRPARVQA